MPRHAYKRLETKNDPVHDSYEVSKLINYIMVDGKVLEEGDPDQIASSKRAQRYYLGDDFAL